MHIGDVIGLVIVLALLLHRLVFRSDPRMPVLVALVIIVLIAGSMAVGASEIADVLGDLFFYSMVLGVIEIAVDAYLEARAGREELPRTKHPFFGEVPERLKRRG
jgi:NTP pyrophosphatase (non-canonical NTP hydrolase)